METSTKIIAGAVLVTAIVTAVIGLEPVVEPVSDASIQDTIQTAIIAGKVPIFDPTVIPTERILSNYVIVAKNLGRDISADIKSGQEVNLFKAIREQAQSKGLVLTPVVDTWATE